MKYYVYPPTEWDPMQIGIINDNEYPYHTFIPKQYTLINWAGFYALRRDEFAGLYALHKDEPEIWYTLGCPYWFLTAGLTAIIGIQLYKPLRRAMLVRRGVCLTCGYDARATPERCPECGEHPTTQRHRKPISWKRVGIIASVPATIVIGAIFYEFHLSLAALDAAPPPPQSKPSDPNTTLTSPEPPLGLDLDINHEK